MYDVIIVGAGPAGLFAAYELITKNKKLKVLLMCWKLYFFKRPLIDKENIFFLNLVY